jgi:alkaline phosphatase
MTNKAISLLNKPKNGKGFFLQVEGASIDKQDHAANACGQIGETLDFDEAIQAALAFAKKDGNTLVIATADHAHSSQIVDNTPPATLSTSLLTADGTTMKVAYGTAAAGGSQQHTGTQVRIAAYGPGAANVVGLSDQTDTFFTMANSLRLDRDTDRFSSSARAVVSDSRPRPSEKITITGTRFAGDRQVTATAGSQDLGTVDVIDGTVTLKYTALTKTGDVAITLRGVQSDATAVAKVRVTR